MAVTGSIDLGWNVLAADGAGGVQTATAGAEESPSGVECLVVSTDTAGKRAVICRRQTGELRCPIATTI